MSSFKLLLGTAILLVEINGFNSLISLASPSYTPPPDGDRQQDTEAYGSRGCSQDSPKLTLLIPETQKTNTLAGHPSFLFALDKIPVFSIIVSLTEPKVAEPIFYQQFKLVRAGIIQVNIPSNTPELQTGKQYVLTVALMCHRVRLSESKFRRVVIKRVGTDATLQQQLRQAKNDYERAQILAEANIGYDAISSAYLAYSHQLLARENLTNFQQFLHQLGIYSRRQK